MGIFKKITEIFRKIVIGYVYYSFPLTLIGLFILASYLPPDLPGYNEEMNEVIMDVIAKNPLCIICAAQFFIWTLISLLFSITMFFSRNNRETFFKKLSGIKERDEREVQIVGKAFRTSYITTMTILLFLLFMSLFYVYYHRKSPDNVEPGEFPAYISFSVGFAFLDSEAFITQKEGYDARKANPTENDM